MPFSFVFGPRQYEYPVLVKTGQVDLAKIRPATIHAVNEMVEERLKRPLSAEENSAEMLLERLGLDSLERMDLALHIEDRFGFRSDRVADTLGELWALAEGQLSTGGRRPSRPRRRGTCRRATRNRRPCWARRWRRPLSAACSRIPTTLLPPIRFPACWAIASCTSPRG